MPIAFDSFKALVRDVNAARFSGDDTTVHLAQGEAGGMKLATGQWVRIWNRNDAIRAENLSVRQQLLDAIFHIRGLAFVKYPLDARGGNMI